MDANEAENKPGFFIRVHWGSFAVVQNDQPGDEFKVRRFPRLLLLVRNDEVAPGLKAGGNTFLERFRNGFHSRIEQLVVALHLRAVIRFCVEQLAEIVVGGCLSAAKVAENFENLLGLREGEANGAFVADVNEIIRLERIDLRLRIADCGLAV
jgi:hypothetical protein